MQVDEEERQGQVYYATLFGSSDASGVDAEPSPKKRRRRRKDLGPTTKDEEDDEDSSEEKSSSSPVEKSSQTRIDLFLAAGGLTLLSRWLVEATAGQYSESEVSTRRDGTRTAQHFLASRTETSVNRSAVAPTVSISEQHFV
jgi:hypothetical protein